MSTSDGSGKFNRSNVGFDIGKQNILHPPVQDHIQPMSMALLHVFDYVLVTINGWRE